MTYVVKRIDEQMYGCEEPAPGAEVLVDVTLVANSGSLFRSDPFSMSILFS